MEYTNELELARQRTSPKLAIQTMRNAVIKAFDIIQCPMPEKVYLNGEEHTSEFVRICMWLHSEQNNVQAAYILDNLDCLVVIEDEILFDLSSATIARGIYIKWCQNSLQIAYKHGDRVVERSISLIPDTLMHMLDKISETATLSRFSHEEIFILAYQIGYCQLIMENPFAKKCDFNDIWDHGYAMGQKDVV